MLCLKGIIDLHKSYKTFLDEQVQPFLDIVQDIYRNMPQAVKDSFDGTISTPRATTVSTPGVFQSPRPTSPAMTGETTEAGSHCLIRGMHSFKVLTECPIIVVLLFQSHRSCVNTNLQTFIPLITEMLALQASPQAEAHAHEASSGKDFCGVAKGIKNRSLFGEFIIAQVKTMSFLAYVLRGYANSLKKYHQAIPDYVIRLLKDCPRELSAARKELLVATRHILSTDFRSTFISKIDVLLNEDVLLGDGVTVRETLRPLAYSMLADLLHHIRSELTPSQIFRTIKVYSKNLHDDSLASSIQTMSAKLLLNLADRIMKLSTQSQARHLLMMILDSFAKKFAALRRAFPHAEERSRLLKEKEKAAARIRGSPHISEESNNPIAIFKWSPINLSSASEVQVDPIKEGKFLFKNLMIGLKTIMFGLKACNPPPPPTILSSATWNEAARGFSEEDVAVLSTLFREGAAGFMYYNVDHEKWQSSKKQSISETMSSIVSPSSKEERDLLEAFATVFIHVDPATFQEILAIELIPLYEAIFRNPSLLHVLHFFLASDATSSCFGGAMLGFLVTKLDQLGHTDDFQSSILLRLYKLAFMGVTLFPQLNETVLLPHLSTIITKSLKLSATAAEPINYFYLFRLLFRSIGGGRFEQLYKEVLPFLQTLLESLNCLLLSARTIQERDLFVELCLTVPVRLSVLLPYLSYLMKPLVIALQASTDLVSQGLRTLELCVDNLTHEFLDPIIAPVVEELMEALWKHLKPVPYSHQHSHTTLRILGKLGGRNRKFLSGISTSLPYKEAPEAGPLIHYSFHGVVGSQAFPITDMVDGACDVLGKLNGDASNYREAFHYLQSVAKLLLDATPIPPNFAASVRTAAESILTDRTLEPIHGDLNAKPSQVQSVWKGHAQQKLMQKVIKGCFEAAAIEILESDASNFIKGLCRQFIILEMGKTINERYLQSRPFALDSPESPIFLDAQNIVDAMCKSLYSQHVKVRELGIRAIGWIHEVTLVIFGSQDDISLLPFMNDLAKKFCHLCYREGWDVKYGGCLGIEKLVCDLDFGQLWIEEHQTEVIRALMFALKDIPPELPSIARDKASQIIDAILRKCNHESKDGVENPRFSHLMNLFIVELSNSNTLIRKTVRESLQTLATIRGVEVHQLLEPVKDRLLGPIYTKPLRALPASLQIGNIDAVTFCLSLPDSFLEFNEELTRLLSEALALADAEDDALLGSQRSGDHKSIELLVSLRIVCIRLLSVAMSSADFNNGPQSHMKARIIAVFFKSLYAKNTDIVDAANNGLKQVLAQNHKLPKDLLQNGLRPILMNLSDHKRLTVAGLEGLARLLELLTNYFKVEIGKKLLDHLRAWAEPAMLQQATGHLLEQHPNIKIIGAIFNIFHLLPPAANMFMEELVTTVVDLEEQLRMPFSNPFGKPLGKYLNKYAQDAWLYFQSRLAEPRYGNFFSRIVRSDESSALKAVLREDVSKLCEIAFNTEDGTEPTAAINAIQIIASLIKSDDKWCGKQADLIRTVEIECRKLQQLACDLPGAIFQHLDCDHTLSIGAETIAYYLSFSQDLPMLFKYFAAISEGTFTFSAMIEEFIKTHVVEHESYSYRRDIILNVLTVFGRKSSRSSDDQEFKLFTLKHVLNAMLYHEVECTPEEESQLFDKEILEAIHTKMWRPALADFEKDLLCKQDQLRIEVLNTSACLVKRRSSLISSISEARKDVIKLGWTYIKMDDATSKHAAYVLIAYFIAQYDTPSKIVVQIYVALLRAHQQEARNLVKQALDLIADVLPQRLPPSTDSRYPHWAKWPRRIVAEDGHNIPQVINVYQFIVRHGDMFYSTRDYFIPQMVNAISKMGFTQSASAETRGLSMDMIDLIADWEQVLVDGSDNRSLPGATAADVNSASEDVKMDDMDPKDPYITPHPCREAIVTYLIRFICISSEPMSMRGLSSRALSLTRRLLRAELWSDVNVKLSFFERNLMQNDITEQNLTPFINAIEVLHVVIESRSYEDMIENLGLLLRLLTKAFRAENSQIHDPMNGLLESVFIRLRISSEDETSAELATKEFLVSIIATLQENIQNPVLMSSSVQTLWHLHKRRPNSVDSLHQNLMKAFQKLAKDHISQGSPNSLDQTNSALHANTSDEQDVTVDTISKIIDIAASRMTSLGDQRRWFLSVLAQLIDRSPNIKLCQKILELVRSWVFRPTESYPMMKEKQAMLTKMIGFESRGASGLFDAYLRLILDIYKNRDVAGPELTVRLEQAFLIGTRARNTEIRNEFLSMFDRSLHRLIHARLNYVLGEQNWESLAESFWLAQALHLLFGSIEEDENVYLDSQSFRTRPSHALEVSGSKYKDLIGDDDLEDLISQCRSFISSISAINASDIFRPISQLQHLNPQLSHAMWIKFFPSCWSLCGKRDRQELTKAVISLLAKDFHIKQMDRRPNVVLSLLESIGNCDPALQLPPHLVKYLGKTLGAWYPSIQILEDFVSRESHESLVVHESALDALAEMYASLSETDLFYGLWRRRCQYLETNAAISYEQNGVWDKAQQLYETAQIKARTGVLPFSESEYTVWEDHWILCAQNLQQWDILTDLSKHEGYMDILLECAWRMTDWVVDREPLEQTIKGLMDAPTPRRCTFDSYMSLIKVQAKLEQYSDFQKSCDEGMQLALRRWHSLPKNITNAHIPLLQNFQQFVELQEAGQIFNSLMKTNAQNLDTRSQELKGVLQAWRERLPNMWDDINSWSDLVAWRQLVFTAINKVYLPLVPSLQQNATGSNASATSFAYRGYHETAWIINRFAHVARKHRLPEVCINQLTKIYTLPNIEIQEAFLKLREQAKCHYQNPEELNTGLEVISNTNLVYFGTQQKAEFFTLKGMFLAKLEMKEEANQAFATAVQIDLNLPKAWAEWGYYNDQLFKENPADMSAASNAVGCYLQAAGLFKNGKARRLLSRVLWLLSLDDAQGSVAIAFEAYRGDVPTWYWITFIPQLLTSLSHKEARLGRSLLVRIAKFFPQALHFHLRTTRDEYSVIKRQALAAAQGSQRNSKPISGSQNTNGTPTSSNGHNDGQSISQNAVAENGNIGSVESPANPKTQSNGNGDGENGAASPSSVNSNPNMQPWEHVEEIMSILKTAFPLLALSMETMVDQIQHKFKSPADEDAYRLIVALLNDGVQYMCRLQSLTKDTRLPPATEANITRFAESVLPKHIKYAFEADFVQQKPSLVSYLDKLRAWRDKFEQKLDRRAVCQDLEQFSPYLSEFQYQKFDEVEIPGQYLLHKDGNSNFVRLDRFLPKVDLIRGHGVCYRRLTMKGHDGSIHPFAVQFPAARHCRREERIAQLFRILNSCLSRRKESRRRGLLFNLPAAVPLSPHIRIIEDDAAFVSLQTIYEEYCLQKGMYKDEPAIYMAQKLRAVGDLQDDKAETANIKMDILNNIQSSMVPSTVARDFFLKSFPSYPNFWLFRKEFTHQYAAATFLSYVMCINNRFPHKLYISRENGKVFFTELLPAMASSNPVFNNSEALQIRFTPNLQTLMGSIGIEGIYSCSIMAIARCLTEPDFELEQHLSIFIRDEIITWYTQQHRPVPQDNQLREKVSLNVDVILRRASSLSKVAQGIIPANQTVIDLISEAVNPRKLAMMDTLFMAYL